MTKYIFKLEIEPDEDMGLDSLDEVQDAIHEALRNDGLDNAANFKLSILEEE